MFALAKHLHFECWTSRATPVTHQKSIQTTLAFQIGPLVTFQAIANISLRGPGCKPDLIACDYGNQSGKFRYQITIKLRARLSPQNLPGFSLSYRHSLKKDKNALLSKRQPLPPPNLAFFPFLLPWSSQHSLR